MGTDPVLPLAGILGERPLSRYDGRDAVWTFESQVAVEKEPGEEYAADQGPDEQDGSDTEEAGA